MIAFVHVAKTAGDTVASLLRSAHGEKYCAAVPLKVESRKIRKDRNVFIQKYDSADVRTLLDLSPNAKSIGGHQIALWSNVEEVIPATTYFLFLRDPVKRAASHFQYNQQVQDMTWYAGQKKLTWDQWVDWDVHHNHQVKMLSQSVDVDDAIRLLESKQVFVGLMESFDESLVLFKKLFCPDLNIAYQRRNTASDNAIAQSVLTDQAKISQIQEMYAKEFLVYDYVAKEMYPRFQREYGDRLKSDVVKFQAVDKNRVNRFNLLRYKLNRKLVFERRYKRLLRETSEL